MESPMSTSYLRTKGEHDWVAPFSSRLRLLKLTKALSGFSALHSLSMNRGGEGWTKGPLWVWWGTGLGYDQATEANEGPKFDVPIGSRAQ